MRKQETQRISWSVCAAVLIGLGMLCQAGAQTTSSQDALVEDDEYYIEWIIPETPPYPPVVIDGKVMTWEEAFGPLPEPKPIAVKRPKTRNRLSLSIPRNSGWKSSANLHRG